MRYDAEQKERTRARVVKEAAKAIRQDGPDRVGVAAIMAKAGLTHGGFYAHFASKDDLIAEAIGEMFRQAGGKFDRIAGELAPAEALATYIDFYLSAEHRDARSSGCPLPTLSADLPRLPDAARERYTAGVHRLNERLRVRLAELGRPEPEQLAASALAELIGALMLSRAVTESDHSDAILARSKRALKSRLGLEDLA